MRVSLELPSSFDAPARARAALAPLRPHIGARTFDDLTLVLTELVSNSVVHGPRRGIAVDVQLDADGTVRGEVRDQGEGVIAIREAVADDEGGFGLRLVDRLADRWGVVDGSTNVWFELQSSCD